MFVLGLDCCSPCGKDQDMNSLLVNRERFVEYSISQKNHTERVSRNRENRVTAMFSGLPDMNKSSSTDSKDRFFPDLQK
jgi:hypothetical protein